MQLGVMTTRNLILIHRGREYEDDFAEIAAKVNALDRTIAVYYAPSNLRTELPRSLWQHPTLTVALMSDFRLPIRRGAILRNSSIGKLVQQTLFRKGRVPTPPGLPFRFGMKLDPILFGPLVILKPLDLWMTSGPDSVFPFRRRQLEELRLDDLPFNHPVRRSPTSFMVQRFVYTGPHPRHLRVQSFFGRVIYCFESRLKQEEPVYDFDIATLRQRIVTTGSGDRARELTLDREAIELVQRAHGGMSDVPSLGFDVIRDFKSGELFVLECNAGGNTWHFSSKEGRALRMSLGRRVGAAGDHDKLGRAAMIAQLGAFDIVAEALVAKVNQLAC